MNGYPPLFPPLPENHFRMNLNNFLQDRGGAHRLEWDDWHTGRLHEATHFATAYVDGREYGCGQGRTKGAARENAARCTLASLLREEPQVPRPHRQPRRVAHQYPQRPRYPARYH